MPILFDQTVIESEGIWNIQSIVFEPTKKHIISISKSDNILLIQCVYDAERVTSYVLNMDKDADQYTYDIFCSFLIDQNIPQFVNMSREINKKPYIILSTNKRSMGNSIYFQSELHTFKMNIIKRHYGFYITIGGMEIAIDLSTPGSLMQIYSEPERGIDSILQKNGDETVDMIKASLQMCVILFNVTTFQFSDNSNIECGIRTMSESPPRKMNKPLSLAHLTILKYGKTWYEYNFNAFIESKEPRVKYYHGIDQLQNPITMPYTTFARKYKLSDEHKDEFEQYYTGAESWIIFLQRIPKSKHCEMTWLPTFLNDIMNYKPNEQQWVIQLNPYTSAPTTSPFYMDLCKLVVLPAYTKSNRVSNKNTKKQRRQRGGSKTLKNKQIVLSFSNTESGQHILI
jgi:hypothetical protein